MNLCLHCQGLIIKPEVYLHVALSILVFFFFISKPLSFQLCKISYSFPERILIDSDSYLLRKSNESSNFNEPSFIYLEMWLEKLY